MNIQDLLRLSNVSRWHIVNTIRHQTVAEHSFNVVLISRAIVENLGWYDLIDEVTEAALYHDSHEAILGDMPTPTKMRLGREMVEEVESGYDHKLAVGYSESVVQILKVADIIEARWFLQNNGSGRHAQEVLVRITEVLNLRLTKVSTAICNAAKKIIEDIDNGDFVI
jgi:5'-deoxynucleotidase YfbR-like HD superfamily hydrolase